ncbi:recombination-associated protein RdgC [Desulfovibrio sp. OttesenSCG-928-O18]|nr:recombination-associated protein RdgC [Desulfovibrio sp. OttesenSCG-928-O18]
MAFLKSSSSFTRFRITEAVPASLWGEVNDRLKQYAFRDIDETSDERSLGWTSFEDMLDTDWREAPPQKGAYIAFSLRLDTRRVPPAVLKKHTALAMKAEEARNREQGKKYISRERKKELREMVQAKLMQRCLPIPAEFNVVWNTADNMIFFASTQPKMIEAFQEHFTKTFNLDLDQLTPYGLAAKILGEDGLSRLDRLEPTRFA